ncbi:TPM domain-containing protein [Algibacter pacificus]|uniref:TPM domain-containing protein n=1 Tax=Algibacter pacificus TaxID=2599389 RepID=UPI0011CCC6EF|nr:TPM domain-containing protein [Algibacter pacificus]
MSKLKVIILLFFVWFQQTNGQEDFPILTEIVTDNAALFSESETLKLREKLKAYETEKTHQIVVLTINSLGNNTVENYANQVFNKNKLGQKDADNGLLILIAKNDRKFRIEVGYGLEPIITDAFASRIIRKTMTPKFKDGRFYEGVNAGTTEIIQLIDDPKYRDEFATLIKEEDKIPLWGKVLLGVMLTLFFSIFISAGGFTFYTGYKKVLNVFRGLIIGKVSVISFPFLLLSSLFLVLFSLPFIVLPLFFAVMIISTQVGENTMIDPFNLIEEASFLNPTNLLIFAVVLFIILPLIIVFSTRSSIKYQPLKFSLLKNDKKYMSKNFSSRGSSSSYRSSSSSSSFSGGGGSSGGGGASGSW